MWNISYLHPLPFPAPQTTRKGAILSLQWCFFVPFPTFPTVGKKVLLMSHPKWSPTHPSSESVNVALVIAGTYWCFRNYEDGLRKVLCKLQKKNGLNTFGIRELNYSWDVPSASLSLLTAASFSTSNMFIWDSFLTTSEDRSSTWPWRSLSFRIIRSASSVTRGGIAA